MNTSNPNLSRSSEQGLFTLLLVGLAAMLLRALSIADNHLEPLPIIPVVNDTLLAADTVLIQPDSVIPDTRYFIQP
jgi:hypothetical protein